ncbi:uncharacterized protein LOC143208329 [Lasioglossum baleicum]|uniref:uncharacterized protein LOC143208329 n=1 Tax=Lasioglossum baleicum TaxID=434251 RepID=UPI003FCD6EB3
MPIAGGILVAGTAAHCLSSAAGMLRFLARLSGRRRHVRRSSGPGGRARAVEETEEAAAAACTAVAVVAGVGEACAGLPAEGRGVGGCEVSVGVGASVLEEVSSPVADGEVCCSDSSTTNYHHRPHHPLHQLQQQQQQQQRRYGHHHRYQQRHRCHQRRDTVVAASDELLLVDEEPDDEATCQEQPHAARHRDIHELHHLHHHHHHHPQHRSHRCQTRQSSCQYPAATATTRSSSRPTHLHPTHELLPDDRPPSDREQRHEDVVDRVDRTTERHADATNQDNPATVTAMTRGCRIPPYLATLLILSYTLFGIADACSSRSTPKPRPPTPTPRPNITFHMYTCPPDYAEWYCLNGATCFTVKIVDSLLYNCLCANGYIGQRCEFKDLDGSYLPSRQRVMLETASIASGATIAVFLVVIICIAAYIHCKRKQKELRSSNCVDTVDGPGRDPELRPFSNRRIFMTKNPNSSAAIEQTRMPGWSSPEAESMRMASISEGKHSNQ